MPEKFHLDQIRNRRLAALLTLIWVNEFQNGSTSVEN